MSAVFSTLLTDFRVRSGKTGAKVAREAGIDASYLSRLERGEREPPRLEVITALARELQLTPEQHSSLLVAAGHPALEFQELGLDATLIGVARVLSHTGVGLATKEAVRKGIEAIVALALATVVHE